MASPQAAIATRTAFSQIQFTTDVEPRTNLPYGLPIVDNCSSCKLRGSGFFCSLSQPTVEALNQIKHTASYPEGALVFMEGQAARGVYMVCQGRVKMLTTNSDGKTLILKIAQAGEILGVHSVVTGKPHELTVETLQPCQLAFIGRDDFLRFIQEHGDACLHATQHLGRDCQSAYDVIRSIGLSHSVSEKLARLLLQWSADARVSNGVVQLRLTLTHEEIAQLIGSSRETVTRTLGDFKKHSVIELHGSALLIRNLSALQKLAAG
ncbi:MAG: Crp/Fnr family transcriptional regulator [Acidobacteriia bacterium]|nr:Crp/Fnr family transcriptional regulator [Terriglobia bacterium]